MHSLGNVVSDIDMTKRLCSEFIFQWYPTLFYCTAIQIKFREPNAFN